jgi:glucose-6-phosphate 1-dehydrogenase
MEVGTKEISKFDNFVSLNSVVSGGYHAASYNELNDKVVEKAYNFSRNNDCNRIFYFAVPISEYLSILPLLEFNLMAKKYFIISI